MLPGDTWPIPAMEGFLNARDLGGHPTSDGRRTRAGVVVRSDTLNPMGEATAAALLARGVTCVVDLRLPEQAARNPSPFATPGAHGVTYHCLPFAGPVNSDDPGFGSLELQYQAMTRSFTAVAAPVLGTIAAAGGTVLVHCEFGKDRTGLVSALLLDVASVPRDAIARDYAESASGLRPVFERFLAEGPGDRATREARLALFTPRPEAMIATLAHIDARHGGVRRYLLGAGVPPAVLEAVRARLVEP